MNPKLLISVLCGYERHGWINPTLASVLLSTQRLPFLAMFALQTDTSPVERARNNAAKMAMDVGAEWLVMFDNDIEPPLNVFQVLEQAGKEHDVIALPYWGCLDGILAPMTVVKDGSGMRRIEPESGFQEVIRAGTGAMFIRRRVFEVLPKPYFAVRLSADGLSMTASEDYDFCDRARKRGFHIWTQGDFACEHLHQYQLGFLAQKLKKG